MANCNCAIPDSFNVRVSDLVNPTCPTHGVFKPADLVTTSRPTKLLPRSAAPKPKTCQCGDIFLQHVDDQGELGPCRAYDGQGKCICKKYQEHKEFKLSEHTVPTGKPEIDNPPTEHVHHAADEKEFILGHVNPYASPNPSVLVDSGVVTRYSIHNTPNEQAQRIVDEILPKVLELYLKKSKDYNGNVMAMLKLGPKASFPDLWRKVGKLKVALWDGQPMVGEQADEILMDLVGHVLIILDEMNQADG